MTPPPAPRPMLPLWLRSGILAAVLGALVLASVSAPRGASEDLLRGEALARRDLHFVDVAGGAVSVLDAADGHEIARFARGEDGFIRSVMRGLARARRARDHGAEQPFTLTVWEAGYLSLEDPATGRSIELTAFGRDNVEAFARLLAKRVS